MSTSTSSTSINDLAAESLAQIFTFLPPKQRVRLERVCSKWRKVAKLAWTDFKTKTLTLNRQEVKQYGDRALTSFRALINRCGPYVRELSFSGLGEYTVAVAQWPMLRNLRHLSLDACVRSDTLRAVADNLPRLQSVHFSDIDWRIVTRLRKLSAFAIFNDDDDAEWVDSFCSLPVQEDTMQGVLPPLPPSLRALHISEYFGFSLIGRQKNGRIDELLELALNCCPQLAMLMLPRDSDVSQHSLVKLARFEKIFYLRLSFNPSDANLFGKSLAKIGAQLNALLLGRADPKVLHLVAKHCPLLKHFSFGIDFRSFDAAEEERRIFALFLALQSIFQHDNLRSVSIHDDDICYALLPTQILDAINGLNAKGNLEYLHLPNQWPLTVDFIVNLIQVNPKLHKLTCMISHNQSPAELGKLKALLQNMARPFELALFGYCPSELKMEANSMVRVRWASYLQQERISQPMLCQFWKRAMDTMPVLIDMDD